MVTIALGTGLAGLASAGIIAGAVGLGIAGIAYQMRNRNSFFNPFSRNPTEYDYYGYRKRRSAKKILNQKNIDDERLDEILEIIRNEDGTKCGMKLMCELGSLPYDNMSDGHKAILDLIGDPDDPNKYPNGSALQEYRTAKYLGRNGYKCAEIFHSCPVPQGTLMNTLTYIP